MRSEQSQAAARRYATLRGALRAMAPAPELLDAGQIEARFSEIRRLLQASSSADGATAESDVQNKVDDALTALTTDLVTTSEKVSFWQYRATLPIVLEHAPKDLESLLEVCMAGTERRWTDLVDYIVTLLATTETQGHRAVRCDPSTMAPCMEEICGLAAEEATDEAQRLDESLAEACDALDRGDAVGDIVQRVREIKRNAAMELFVPTVLRRVVAFNAAVHNRMTQQEETRRSMHEAELDVMSEPASEPQTTGSNDLPAYGSFELGRVESAIADRLARKKPTDSHAARIAETFDLSKLSAFEKTIFAESSKDHVASVVRAVTTIGLVVRHLDQVSDDLRALGIDPDWMRRSSSGEIDSLAQQGTREFMRTGNFDHAQQLAELRSRYLNPLFDEERMIPKPSATGLAAPVAAAAPIVKSTPRDNAPRRHRLLEDDPEPRSSTWWRIPLIVGVVIAIGAGVFLNLGTDASKGGQQYNNAQLLELSPYLTSGFRTDGGSGNSFMGTVNAAWSRVPSAEQRASAARIGEVLAERGISHVEFHDIGGTLRLLYENGSIRELH